MKTTYGMKNNIIFLSLVVEIAYVCLYINVYCDKRLSYKLQISCLFKQFPRIEL